MKIFYRKIKIDHKVIKPRLNNSLLQFFVYSINKWNDNCSETKKHYLRPFFRSNFLVKTSFCSIRISKFQVVVPRKPYILGDLIVLSYSSWHFTISWICDEVNILTNKQSSIHESMVAQMFNTSAAWIFKHKTTEVNSDTLPKPAKEYVPSFCFTAWVKFNLKFWTAWTIEDLEKSLA